jgi:hypothetical protein
MISMAWETGKLGQTRPLAFGPKIYNNRQELYMEGIVTGLDDG